MQHGSIKNGADSFCVSFPSRNRDTPVDNYDRFMESYANLHSECRNVLYESNSDFNSFTDFVRNINLNFHLMYTIIISSKNNIPILLSTEN